MTKMKLVFATNNTNKLKEIQALLPETIELLGLKDIGCVEDIPETAPDLEGNARQKSFWVYEKYGYDCFSDDTGLEIEALNGEPGVYSARYAGKSKSANANMEMVLEKLEGIENRAAQFRTIVSLVLGGKEYQFEGKVEGKITLEKSGVEGFGYDPIFEPENKGITFAEMTQDQKNSMSHRGRAVEKLIDFIKENKG